MWSLSSVLSRTQSILSLSFDPIRENCGQSIGLTILLPIEPTDTCKQPITTRYLGHVTGYQPIRDQYFLIWSVPGYILCSHRPLEGEISPSEESRRVEFWGYDRTPYFEILITDQLLGNSN
eukprot:sb/3476130/